MPITAKQTKNTNWGFEVVQERLLRASGNNAPIYANVRTDTDEVLGYSTDRYGIVQNDDLLGRAESAFASRGITYDRNVYATDNGAKMRAVYDLQGPQFETKVPQVGDIMGYRLTVQNSFDRTLRVSFALVQCRSAASTSSPPSLLCATPKPPLLRWRRNFGLTKRLVRSSATS